MFWRDFEGVTEGCRVGSGGLLIYKPVWTAVECLTAHSYRGDNQSEITSLSQSVLHFSHETRPQMGFSIDI